MWQFLTALTEADLVQLEQTPVVQSVQFGNTESTHPFQWNCSLIQRLEFSAPRHVTWQNNSKQPSFIINSGSFDFWHFQFTSLKGFWGLHSRSLHSTVFVLPYPLISHEPKWWLRQSDEFIHYPPKCQNAPPCTDHLSNAPSREWEFVPNGTHVCVWGRCWCFHWALHLHLLMNWKDIWRLASASVLQTFKLYNIIQHVQTSLPPEGWGWGFILSRNFPSLAPEPLSGTVSTPTCYCLMFSTLSGTRTRDLDPQAVRRASPTFSYGSSPPPPPRVMWPVNIGNTEGLKPNCLRCVYRGPRSALYAEGTWTKKIHQKSSIASGTKKRISGVG